jgi:hypothetical protein
MHRPVHEPSPTSSLLQRRDDEPHAPRRRNRRSPAAGLRLALDAVQGHGDNGDPLQLRLGCAGEVAGGDDED